VETALLGETPQLVLKLEQVVIAMLVPHELAEDGLVGGCRRGSGTRRGRRAQETLAGTIHSLLMDAPSATEPRSRKPRREPWPLWLHYAVLLALQSAYAWIYVRSPWLRTAILVPPTLRLAIWTLPVLAFLALERRPVLKYLKLRDHALRGLAWGAAVGTLVLAGNAAAHCVLTGSWQLDFDIGLSRWLGPVALVGLSEEVAFRGFFLQEFAERMGFGRANILQAILFLLIHLPGWTLMGQLHSRAALQLAGSVLLFALFAGWLLRRTRSLWACMIVHSCNNLASVVAAV